MKALILKKLELNELENKLNLLRESKIFNEDFINLIGIACANGMPVELTEEQSVALTKVGLIENEVIENGKNNSVEIKKEENEIKEQEKEFVPKSEEEIANMPPEEIGKMYYLSPERIIESIKRINDGKTWRQLAQSSNNQVTLQSAIERAYRSCVYPSDLTDPNFLDERIGNYLPENNQAVQLKDLHMAALMGTYVGYHIEKNEGEIESQDVNENQNIAIIKFPMLVDEMPETLKAQTEENLKKAINNRVKEIMSMSDSYKALMLLVPMEKTIDKAVDDYSESLHDTEEHKAIRAYIKAIRSDLNENSETKFEDLNVSLDLYDLDWNDSDTRKSTINMIKKIQGQGQNIDISKFVEEINMSFEVNSVNDIGAVRAACKDLSELSEKGVEVNIAFDMPANQLLNPELQEELNNTVSEYENINRDTTTELVNNGVETVIDEAIDMTTETVIAEASVNLAQDMINGVSMAADELFDISQEREEAEFMRPGRRNS